jgi:hypothetical protein
MRAASMPLLHHPIAVLAPWKFCSFCRQRQLDLPFSRAACRRFHVSAAQPRLALWQCALPQRWLLMPMPWGQF